MLIDQLVDNRFVQPDLTFIVAEQQVTIAVEAHTEWQFIETGEFQNDAGGIAARSNYKIVFQSLPVAVIQKIHTRVDSLKVDFGVVGNANDPAVRIAADEIIALAIDFFSAVDFHRGIGGEQFHANTHRRRGAGGTGGSLILQA